MLGLIVFVLVSTVAGAVPSESVDDELTGEHLVPLFLDQVGTYALDEVNPRDDRPLADARYLDEGDGSPIQIALTYGEEAAERYRSLRAQIVRDEEDPGELEVDGQRFILLESRRDISALRYVDGFLIVTRIARAAVRPGEDFVPTEDYLTRFLEDFDAQRLSEWEPPVEAAREAAVAVDIPDCLDMECFDEYVSACEAAQVVAPGPGQNANAVYTVEQPTDNGQCRLSFVFFDNPNPEWEDEPLYFNVDPEESFVETGREAVSACLDGEGEKHGCEGPLLEVIE